MQNPDLSSKCQKFILYKTLRSRTILQFFYYNFNKVDFEWLFVTYIWIHNFFFITYNIWRYSDRKVLYFFWKIDRKVELIVCSEWFFHKQITQDEILWGIQLGNSLYGVIGKRTNPNLKTYICQFRSEPEKPHWTIHTLLFDSTEFDWIPHLL